jgi:hypothetical protein
MPRECPVDALAKTWASEFREIPDFSGDPARLEFDALPNLSAGPAAMLGPRGCQRLTPRRCLRCLGVHSGAHWGVGTPEISMASEYNTGVSGGFRQAGNNVVLSRTLLPVGTLQRGAGPDGTNAPQSSRLAEFGGPHSRLGSLGGTLATTIATNSAEFLSSLTFAEFA